MRPCGVPWSLVFWKKFQITTRKCLLNLLLVTIDHYRTTPQHHPQTFCPPPTALSRIPNFNLSLVRMLATSASPRGQAGCLPTGDKSARSRYQKVIVSLALPLPASQPANQPGTHPQLVSRRWYICLPPGSLSSSLLDALIRRLQKLKRFLPNLGVAWRRRKPVTGNWERENTVSHTGY